MPGGSRVLLFACPAVRVSGVLRAPSIVRVSGPAARMSYCSHVHVRSPALRLSSCELARLQVMCADMSDMRGHVRKWYEK